VINLRQLLVTAIITLWAAFATYQWISTSAKTDLLIEAALADANLSAQKTGEAQAEKARTESGVKTEEIKIVYKTIKEVVYKNRFINQCPGNFSNELRLGLSEATAAANGAVLTTQH